MLKKSEYVRISKTVIKKLVSNGCWGAGSLYEENLISGIQDQGNKIKKVLNALVKQEILFKKPKLYGVKYYLNPERREKIMEIIKERPRKRQSLLLLLLFDF